MILLDRASDDEDAERVFDAPATPPTPPGAAAQQTMPLQLALPQGLVGTAAKDKDKTKDVKDEAAGTPLRVPQPEPDPGVYGFNGIGVADVLRLQIPPEHCKGRPAPGLAYM
eukprot:g1131.t1